MKNDRFITIRCIFVPVGWDAASPGNEKIRLPNDRTYAGAAAQPLVCLSFPDAFFFCPGTPEPLPVSRHPSASSGTGRTRKAPTLREKCRGIRRSGRSAHPCGPRHGYSAPPVADGVFSVHRCFSISTNHSGQRHGRRVSLRMNPSTVDPVLSSSPRSFRIS